MSKQEKTKVPEQEPKEERVFPKFISLFRKKANIFRFGMVMIRPGLNDLTDPVKIKTCMSHPSWDTMIQMGTHRVIEEPTEDPKENEASMTSDISKMSQKDAFKWVKELHDIKELEALRDREAENKNRGKIMNAIEDKIKDMGDLPVKKASN